MTILSDHSAVINQILQQTTNSQRSKSRGFSPGVIKADSEHIYDADEVFERLKSFGALSGWVQSASSVVPIDKLDQAVGRILCAEVTDEEASLHIRQDGDGGWIVTRYQTLAAEDGAEGLVTEKRFIARKPHRSFFYQVGWRLEPTDGELAQWRPYAARLIHKNSGE